MNLWDEIIDGIIKNFSPIISALIAAMIAGVSAYLTWKSYKNSHDATPPELLKYEKWLDIIKKRKEVLDKMPMNIKEDKFSKSREESFARTLELYERSAIWEGEVISITPVKIYRKCLLRLDPQLALGENILSPGRFSTTPVSYIVATILILLNVFISIFSFTGILISVVYYSSSECDFKFIITEWFLFVNFLLGVVFSISIASLKGITVSISILYYYKIRERVSLNFPNFVSIISRKLYMSIEPNSPLFPLSKDGSIKVILRGIFSFGFLCAPVFGMCLQVRDLYISFINHNVDFSYPVILSIIFVYTATYLTYVYVKNEFFSHDILGEYELSLLNGRWKFFYQENEYNVTIKDGEVNVNKFNEGIEQSTGNKKLSVHDMKRAIKGKLINISNIKEMKIRGVRSPEGFSFSILEWKGEEVSLVKK